DAVAGINDDGFALVQAGRDRGNTAGPAQDLDSPHLGAPILHDIDIPAAATTEQRRRGTGSGQVVRTSRTSPTAIGPSERGTDRLSRGLRICLIYRGS